MENQCYSVQPPPMRRNNLSICEVITSKHCLNSQSTLSVKRKLIFSLEEFLQHSPDMLKNFPDTSLRNSATQISIKADICTLHMHSLFVCNGAYRDYYHFALLNLQWLMLYEQIMQYYAYLKTVPFLICSQSYHLQSILLFVTLPLQF